MEPILISACLLGAACRYDGGSKPVLSVEALMGRYQLVPVCPEQLGGLPTPREPSERQGDLVVMKSGADVTAQYQRGAEQALHLARVFGCKKAVLKERSPSCGSGEIYDGTFSGKLTPGNGVTAALFKKNGIEVFGESHVDAIARQYGIPHTAALPIDRKLAASADKGMIELTNGDWLDEIANAIDQLQPRERK